jgi:biotin carboxylase
MTAHVLVSYGLGSASPRLIAAAAQGTCDILWRCNLADEHARTMIPVLQRFGTVMAFSPDKKLNEQAEAILRRRPAGITTFSDPLIQETAELARLMQLEYQSPWSARSVTDKLAQRHALKEAGIQDISFQLATTPSALATAIRAVGTPAVVKPVQGQGSCYAFRIACPADLEDTLAWLSRAELARGFIVEQELAGTGDALGQGIGDYVSVECVTLRGEHQVVGVVGRLTIAPPFRERGGFYPSTLDQDTTEAVCSLAHAGLTAVRFSCGVSHTEVKMTPTGPQILEINGRLGGHVAWLIARNGGPDLIRAALLTALGISPLIQTVKADGVAFRHVPPAPLQIGIATKVEGQSEVRRVPCVESIEVRVRPGMLVDWRQGTGSCIAEISGRATTHDEMVRCTNRAEKLLRVTLAPAPANASAHTYRLSPSAYGKRRRQ